jgi:hypothetical protein
MVVQLKKIWINEFKDRRELRMDWSNDRHHAVEISHPCGPDQVAKALQDMARLVFRDPHLPTNNI